MLINAVDVYMTSQEFYPFLPVVFLSTVFLWVLTSAVPISLKKHGRVLRQVIGTLKSSPGGQLCLFSGIIQSLCL